MTRKVLRELPMLLVLLLSGNKPPHRDDEDSGPN